MIRRFARALGLGLGVALRADPWRAVTSLVLSRVEAFSAGFAAYGLKLLIDGVASQDSHAAMTAIVFIAVLFVYTTAAIVIEKPVGLLISSCFIATILLTSFISRIARSRELRFAGFKAVDFESKLLWDTIRDLELTILVPHRPGRRTLAEKEQSIRREHRIPRDLMVVFVEVELTDASEFVPEQVIHVREEQGRYILRITKAASISHTLAALALEMAKVGRAPEIHFGWTEESILSGTLGFLLFGEGNVPWMVRALIRKAEPNPSKRPLIIIAGA